jgi:ketosteroid isomerase-like protein
MEVWRNVETYWSLYAAEDLEGFMGYFHDEFLGWVQGDWVPTNKADRRASLVRGFETGDLEWYSLKPVGIKVHGDVAIVHYLYTTNTRSADGEQASVTGAWTDILMKQGNKWVMIGDAGVSVSEN